MPDPRPTADWDRYLVEYHDTNPGITEDVLADALDDEGRSPYDWLVDAVPSGASMVVDLACGSMPLAPLLPGGRVIGVDQSAGELARARGRTALLLRARGSALPVVAASADAVVASMALMLMRPLGPVLAEVARVLRPGGTLVATLPLRAAAPGPPAAPPFAEILGALGQAAADYPEPLHGATAAEKLSAAGLRLHGDDTISFARTVRGPDDAERVVRSFYAPGAGPRQVAAAVEELQRRVRAAPVGIGYRVRRLVAQR